MGDTRQWLLPTPDRIPLFVTDSLIARSAGGRRGVVLMHGLGEHSGRHAHVMRFFNDCGWSVRSFDHRGHGRSGGAPGDIPDSEAMLRDAKLVIDDFARELDSPPLLFGHSMGGLFAARFATAALAPLRGLILSSPGLALRLSAPQKFLLKIMYALAPGLAVPNGLETRYLSHDQKIVEAYEIDPLVHPKISARLLRGMLDAIEFSQAHAATIAVPTLMLVAGDDHLVDPDGSQRFFARLGSGIGTMHVYPSFYHEVFNELDARLVFDDARVWLERFG